MKINCYDCGFEEDSKALHVCKECKKAECTACFIIFHEHSWINLPHKEKMKLLNIAMEKPFVSPKMLDKPPVA